jgi:hypothetical protein
MHYYIFKVTVWKIENAKIFCGLLFGFLLDVNDFAAENILPYWVKSGKHYAGTPLNNLSVCHSLKPTICELGV